jgi:outer membrane lipase/esterase
MTSCTRRLLAAATLSLGFCSSQALAQIGVACALLDVSNRADFCYAMLAAPSEASFLAESAVKTRLGLVSTIQSQIALSQSHRGASGVNAWASGSTLSLSMRNYPGLPDDPDIALTGTAGADYTLAPGLVAGFALSGGSLDSSLGRYGSFKVGETSGSLYAGWQEGALWANAIGTYGRFGFDMTRIVPLGQRQETNTGSAGGDNWSAALQGGYVFTSDKITHGPLAGFVYQNANIDGFSETGGLTALEFGGQARQSTVGQLGYLAIYELGKYQPYVEALWNHEFASTGGDVSAQLVSFKALPAFSMPAVLLGKDWGEAKAGVKIDVGSGVKLVVEGSADFGQTSTTLLGGQIGLNTSF